MITFTLYQTFLGCIALYLLRIQVNYILKLICPKQVYFHINRLCFTCVGIQFIARLLQNVCISLSGIIEEDLLLPMSHQRINMIGQPYQYDQLSSFFGKIRRINRVYRTPILLKSIWDQLQKQSKKQADLYHLYGIFAILGDSLFVLSFMVGDYSSTVYLSGLYGDKNFQFMGGFYSDLLWLISSFCYILKILLGFYLIHFDKRQEINIKNIKTLMTYGLIRNICEVMGGFACLFPGLVSKKQYGMYGQIISVLNIMSISLKS